MEGEAEWRRGVVEAAKVVQQRAAKGIAGVGPALAELAAALGGEP
jgi:hypothetical protein